VEARRTSSQQRSSNSWGCQQHHTCNHTALGGFAKEEIFVSADSVDCHTESNPSRMRYYVMFAPLDVCDVLLGHPYMWKRHAIYESRPRSVIITLGGHLYRIPEVVPTTTPPKQCRKVVSHTTKFIFSTICSKGEQKDTAATTASAKAPSIQQKQVDKVAAKHEDSFCPQSSKIARLVKKVQTFQPQVRDRFPQTKQHDFSSKTSSSPRCRFN
jgi:hypothetical protein